ncbi:MAG TPA: FTR1 family protein [Acidimicrobiales bacterium]|nr:FTR1 family protein [Acidimicrobiales bacterium]
MVATFVIFLREGIEASMIVAILLAYLDRIGKRRYFVDVLAGVGAALVLAGAAGVTAYLTIHTYAGTTVQTVFETCTYLLAAVVLTYMTFWMRNHARTIAADLQARTEAAISTGERRGLFLIAFQAVGREGLETVVFTLAVVFSSSAHGAVAGGVAGLVVALGIAFAVYKLGKRLNVALFFKVVGALLMVFAAGLLVDAVEDMQSLGWIPSFGRPLWNTNGVLDEGSTLGDIVHTFFGYVGRPNVLEVVVWLGYVLLAVTAFLGLWHRRRPAAAVGAGAHVR